MLTLTESAILKANDVLAEEGRPDVKIRIFVQGGGCSGFQYGFMIEDIQNDDDFVIQDIVLADAMSMQYLQGATVDYIEELHGSHFKIVNPNAQSTCGCGSSFSV